MQTASRRGCDFIAAGFPAFIRKQYDEYGIVVRDAKIKAE